MTWNELVEHISTLSPAEREADAQVDLTATDGEFTVGLIGGLVMNDGEWMMELEDDSK